MVIRLPPSVYCLLRQEIHHGDARNERTGPSIARPAAVAKVDYYHPKRRVKWGPIVRHAVLMLFVLVVLVPLFWVVLLSIKSFPDAVQR